MSAWAIESEPVNVFGITLRDPLTIAHIMLMSEAGSPILTGAPIMPGDLALAAFICSQPADKAKRALKSWTAGITFKLWGFLFWKRNLREEAEKFGRWFTWHASVPPRWTTPGGRALSSPWWINRVAIAMGECGMTYTDATTLPCRIVGQITTSLMEARGLVDLESEEQTQFIRWAMAQAGGRN